MKADLLKEVRERIKQGYKGELLYNYRSGFYEITTWKSSDVLDQKTYKIPRGVYEPRVLVEAVYGKKYT